MGRGGNKKEAEQRAAMQALRKLKGEVKLQEKRKDQKGIREIITQVRKKIKI
ncbi:MAG: hypothetical protein KJ811_03520 [Candidatus Margulisbacteria bacterium]|nr:hypothetical protein [Candidatus Margulisiibacteriota bacterium]